MSHRARAALFASCAATACAAGAAGQVVLHAFPIDNTFRVPDDSNFDPAQWTTVELRLQSHGCAVIELAADFDFTAFHSPGGEGSIFPVPVALYDLIPLARYDSFLELPAVDPSDTLVSGGSWTSTGADVVLTTAPANAGPVPSDSVRIGRATLRNDEQINRFDIAKNLLVGCTTGGPELVGVPLAGPFGTRFAVRETGDQYDAQVSLELLFHHDEYSFSLNSRAALFIPASRVRDPQITAEGWHAQKAWRDGEFGILVTSDDLVPEDEPAIVVLEFETDESLLRDVRFPRGQVGPDGFFEVRTMGYWAPVADTRIPGDVDDTGRVDFADLNLLLNDFGSAPTAFPTDINGDGVVNFSDLNTVLNNFGAED